MERTDRYKRSAYERIEKNEKSFVKGQSTMVKMSMDNDNSN
jgi:hypothetical protein